LLFAFAAAQALFPLLLLFGARVLGEYPRMGVEEPLPGVRPGLDHPPPGWGEGDRDKDIEIWEGGGGTGGLGVGVGGVEIEVLVRVFVRMDSPGVEGVKVKMT
jgi:hypothetical protein